MRKRVDYSKRNYLYYGKEKEGEEGQEGKKAPLSTHREVSRRSLIRGTVSVCGCAERSQILDLVARAYPKQIARAIVLGLKRKALARQIAFAICLG